MKHINNTIIIGVDHGFGNIKYSSGSFRSGLMEYDEEPSIKNNLLIYENKYYLIGTGHKEFTADKMGDQDYYILTLAAIASELKTANITNARVHIAAGLPLTWVISQRKEFKAYLMQKDTVDFIYNGIKYHIEIVGADVFPQGFAAVADKMSMFHGTNMLCDIGNGTMSVMYIKNKVPDTGKCFTDKFGTEQCVMRIREAVFREHHIAIDDNTIDNVIIYGRASISQELLKTMTDTAKEYVKEIFRKLREHEYSPLSMRLYIVGCGGCLIKNFGEYDKSLVDINTDICATVKGYEYLSEIYMRMGDNT